MTPNPAPTVEQIAGMDDKLNVERLRALDAAATAGQVDVRQHTKAPADSKNAALDRVKLSIQIGPLGGFARADGELLASLWNNRSAILAMADDNARSEKHRNDLYDKVMAQATEIGALKTDNVRLREVLEPLATRDDSIGDDARQALANQDRQS